MLRTFFSKDAWLDEIKKQPIQFVLGMFLTWLAGKIGIPTLDQLGQPCTGLGYLIIFFASSYLIIGLLFCGQKMAATNFKNQANDHIPTAPSKQLEHQQGDKVRAYKAVEEAGRTLGSRTLSTDKEYDEWKSEYKKWLATAESAIREHSGHAESGHFQRSPSMWTASPFVMGYDDRHRSDLTHLFFKLEMVTKKLEQAMDGH